ncbi:MAG TPA: 3-hydroxylacyl-ACP dehydratase [Burkholderiaceae bacterium]|nr:3-hydroxylacyl-ACP dehydratase [Burkholderiaceae bacterium]
MLTRSIEVLLPHAGRMRLIDRIMSYDEHEIVCESDSHRAADHPLAEAGMVSIVCGLEYGAQAMAIHGALLARGDSDAPVRHGYLVAASDLRWSVERLDQCAAPIVIKAVSEFRADNQVAYRFEISASGAALLTGRASVVLHAPIQ